MNNDNVFGKVEFSVATSLKPWNGEPDEFVLQIKGTIRVNVFTTDGERVDVKEGVGEIGLWLVLAIEAENQRVNLYDVFDAHSDVLEAVYAAIFEDAEPKAELQIEPLWRNLLYVSGVNIQEKYHQIPIRVQAIETAIAAFGSGSIIVADKDELGLNADEWKLLDFKKIAQTTLAFRDNCCKNPYGLKLDQEE